MSQNLYEIQATLTKGMRVQLIENGEEVVAEGVITSLLPGELEFTDTDPKYKGFKKEFAFKREWGGWKGLHEDPFTKARCFSELAPIYFFKPIEEVAAKGKSAA